MTVRLAHIYRHPVKGLSPEALQSARLEAGSCLAGDRRFALALSSARFDPDHPTWLPKTNFLMLMRDEKLATLDTALDAESGILTVSRKGKELARGKITEPVGRAVIEDFFAAYMGERTHGKPRLVEARAGHAFADSSDVRVVSLINLASIRDLERVIGGRVDPLRFRANLYIEGAAPWAEFGWVGREIAVGAVRLAVTARIKRCAATNVDPATGARDMNVPLALKRGFGHVDMGVYAKVVDGGTLTVGDDIEPPAASRTAEST